MIKNNHIEELIVRYFQEEIDEEDIQELEAWIMESPENKSGFFQLKGISDSSRRSICSEADKEASWQRMQARLQAIDKQEKAISGTTRSLRPVIWFKYASIVLLALAAGWGINGWISGEEPIQTVLEPVYNEIKIDKGGRGNTLILSDGSKVTLNAATTFRYPTNFSAVNRTVYLDGEAYFEVTKDETKPFVVKLEKQDVTVLGTSFNVEAYGDESYSVLTLLSGSVALESYNETGEPMSKMFLKPNQRAVSDNLSGSVSLENIDTSLADAWTEGKYKFKDEPLWSIARRLEKYYNVKVHIESKTLMRMKYTGSFALNQDIEEILHVLNQEKRCKIKKQGKEVTIAPE